MALVQFVRNHHDRSNAQGFQFEFICDKCGNGYMSRYMASTMGMASGVLKAAGAIFGGVLGRVASGTDNIKDSYRGKARDDAFGTAVEEAKKHFKHCTRCGKWVCPEVCWNAAKQLCEECAPDLSEEAAAQQAQAGKEQVAKKAREVDQTKGVDMSRDAVAQCPDCGAKVGTAKFCPECGKPTASAKSACAKCGVEMAAGVKFCPECGAKRA